MSAGKEAEECSEECSKTLLHSSCNLKALKIIIIKTFIFHLEKETEGWKARQCCCVWPVASQPSKTNRQFVCISMGSLLQNGDVEKGFKHRFTFFLNVGRLFFVSLKIAKFKLNVTLEHKMMASLEQNGQEKYKLPLKNLLLSLVLI